MQTLETYSILTIGYEGRTANELLSELAQAHVTALVDVRLTPLSRKPGLSKRHLANQLEQANIWYLHMPALGNPRDNRDAFRQGVAQSRTRFRDLLQRPDAQEALGKLWSVVYKQRVALLCFEQDATTCHRFIVSEALLGIDPALAVEHL
ncbi:MAG: DUF488 domain-containing protein [Pseudonocardiales bacterium]|nr:DUF488 domain-containing protein [Pseudonocardiales bacterium]